MEAHLKNLALLEDIRRRHGNDRTRDAFSGFFRQDAHNAMRMLNDESLGFPLLHIIRPEITALSLDAYLYGRNRLSLGIIKMFLSPRPQRLYRYKQEDCPVLRWMIDTGHPELDLGDDYDRIMDFTAILLIKEHHDKTCLQQLGEIIFGRHRKGLNTYDAEWAFFESQDPECLAITASRLRSSDPKDVELARRLLKFIPCFDDDGADPEKQYRCATAWIDGNKPYLRYTGETGLRSWNPTRFEVLPGFKYMQKPFAEHDSLSSWEQTRMNEFKGLNADAQTLLSEYSHQLCRSGREKWDAWMRLSLPEQIAAARHGGGAQ